MGIFATLAETFGQDGLTLSVALERSRCQWGEPLCGSVEIRGGTADRSIRHLSVRVVEHVDGGKDFSSWHPHEATWIGSEIAVPALSVQSFPFTMRLPETGNPSAEGSVVRFLWSVEAEAHVTHSHTPHTALAGFDLQYPPLSDALQALRDALSTAAPLRLRSESRLGARAVFQFTPLPEAAAALDGVNLIVEEIDGAVVGTLQVNPQEHSLADHARSLVRRDREDHAVNYPSVSLAASRGGPPPADVLNDLKNLLRPYLFGRTHS